MNSSHLNLAFDALQGEAHDFKFWVGGGSLIVQLFDFRWCFRTEACARDFYGVVVEDCSEESNPPPCKMVRTDERLAGLPAGASCLVLRAHNEGGPASGGPGAMTAVNAIFQVGRICAKVYFTVLMGPAAKITERHKALTTAVASRGAARVVEACAEPMSVPDA